MADSKDQQREPGFFSSEHGIAIALLVVLVCLVTTMGWLWGFDWKGIRTEATGFVFDIALFGVLLAWFRRQWEVRDRVRRHREELADYRFLKGDEAVCRKVGIIKRLVDLGQSQLDLEQIELGTDLNHPPANLGGVDLSNANLGGADLSGANLSRAHLRGAYLNDAGLSDAFLGLADLSGADLGGASLSRADLRGTNLSGADLSGADLRGAHLTGAHLNDSKLNGADLSRANLFDARDLTQVQLDTAYAEVDDPPKLNDGLKLPPPPPE